jgi:hypothetical protein
VLDSLTCSSAAFTKQALQYLVVFGVHVRERLRLARDEVQAKRWMAR